ncbi:zinc finger protein 260-like isoform X1 [Cydia pomonella]|uniref:zinc finger protein 260-like isoform X1 n=1 Tax=Cydia pomonella TaxID=82600 RepID=UPI002ADD5414|nr:zinc finger protein 260-like isoform X1 [Cydia pomonella]
MDVFKSCRCCLQATADLNLTIPYPHLDRTEIYLDMLKNCFDLHLTLSDNDSHGICSTCVGRLRDASDFKLQVQRCQEELQSHLLGVSHVNYENAVFKTENFENHGSEDENASHVELVTMKAEIITEGETENVLYEDSLVKSERSDGIETCNEDDISVQSDPLGGATGAGTEPAAAMSRDETFGPSSHATDTDEDSLLKLKRSDGRMDAETRRTMPRSGRTEPLGGTAGEKTEPAATTSCDEKYSPSSHPTDVSDTGETHSGDEAYTSDTSEEQEKHIDQQRYPCDLCDKDFVNKSAWKRHQRVIHAIEKMYTCDKCNKKFTKKDYLRKHKCPYTGEEPFGCNVCGKKFTKKSYLHIHKASHNGEKPHKCDKCNRRFARKCFLQQHEKTPCEENYFTCEVCNKQCKQKKALKSHILIHTGVKPYGCNECDKRFSAKNNLKAHKKIHTGDKYSCEDCDKQFITQNSLSRHKITHTGQKYECKICNKQFSQNYTLKAHQKIHTGEKVAKAPKKRPYTCKDCNKRFISKTDLDRHATVHTGEKPYACKVCQKKFSQKSTLCRHIETCKSCQPC